jgi:hypothetical protein
LGPKTRSAVRLFQKQAGLPADAATRQLVVHLARRGRMALRLACRSNEIHPALDAMLDALDASRRLRRLAITPLSHTQLGDLLVLGFPTQDGLDLLGADGDDHGSRVAREAPHAEHHCEMPVDLA